MSSFKRKVGPGGCEETESSESDREITHAPKKKSRSFMLPRQGGNPFASSSILPKSNSSVSKQVPTTPGVSQPPKEGQTYLVPPTPHSTSSMELEQEHEATLASAGRGSSSLLKGPVISNRKQGTENTKESSDDETSRPPTTGARSRVQFERGLNEIRTSIETFKADVNGRLTRIEEFQANSKQQQDFMLAKLGEVLGCFEKWNSNLGSIPSTSNTPVVSKKQTPTIVNMNPKADPGLYEVCRRIDREGAIGKEFGKFEAPLKSFARRGSCLALRIPDFKRAPMFYSINGVPDFFPEAFREENGYCQPFLHWNLSFAENYPCIPTLVLSVRSLFPNDETPIATAARELTDNQIISLICHGPFKSLRLTFTGAKNASPDDPDIKYAGKRGVSRLEEKFFHRRLYRPRIKTVLETSWDGLWYKAVMSPEISDGVGGFIIQRQLWRAGWFNNLVTSADNARRAIQLAKPGRHVRGKRTIEYVEGSPPTLFSNEGEVVKIPLCMISKVWRNNNQAWMEAMPHLIDTSLSKKPDILAFINAHPPPDEPKEDEEEEFKEGDGGGDGRRNQGGDEGGDDEEDDEDGQLAGRSEGVPPDGELDQVDPCQLTDADGEDTHEDLYAPNLVQDTYSGPQDLSQQVSATMSVQPQQNVIIDPSLLTPSSEPQTESSLRPRTRPRARPPPVDPPTAQSAPTPTIHCQGEPPSSPEPLPASLVQTMPLYPSTTMPPPPLLSEQNTTPTMPENEVAKKRRGRPPGARNKKTLEKLAAAVAEDEKA